MSKIRKIRKNNVTNKWEHWVPSFGNTPGYWAEGIQGYTISPIEEYASRNINNEILLYEELDGQIFEFSLTTPGLPEEEEKQIDKKITELLNSQKIKELKPVIIKTLAEIYGEFEILRNTNKIFSVQVINPNPYTEVIYKWILQGDPISEDDTVEIFFNTEGKNELKCEIENPSGKTATDKLTIKVIDPVKTDLFGVNLIKNSNATEGLKNWTVVNGSPNTFPIISNPTRFGYFGNQNFTVELEAVNPLFGSKNDMLYFVGGEAVGRNRIVTLYQEIDISKYANIIDRKVLNTSSITGRLFAWFGAMGYGGRAVNTNWSGGQSGVHPTYPFPGNWNEGHKFPLGAKYNGEIITVIDANLGTVVYDLQAVVHDKLYLNLYCLTENNKLIETHVLNVRDTNHSQKFSLEHKFFNIPVGTRKFKIEIVFEKNDLNRNEYGDYWWFYRYWEDAWNWYVDHLTAISNINLVLDINGLFDEYYFKFNENGFVNRLEYTEDITGPNGSTLINTTVPSIIPEEPEKPIANFTVGITESPIFVSIKFNNLSSAASSYLWDFGDGTVSNKTNPEHIYTQTGKFTVKLKAYNGVYENTFVRPDLITTYLP